MEPGEIKNIKCLKTPSNPNEPTIAQRKDEFVQL